MHLNLMGYKLIITSRPRASQLRTGAQPTRTIFQPDSELLSLCLSPFLYLLSPPRPPRPLPLILSTLNYTEPFPTLTHFTFGEKHFSFKVIRD